MGKALLAGCIALAFSNMALAEDIKVAVVGAMSGPVAQYGDHLSFACGSYIATQFLCCFHVM